MPGPVEIAKTVIFLMRDRGTRSPLELRGVSRLELEANAALRKKRKSPFPTFDASLEAAIARGWVVAYPSEDGETRYVPHYR